MSEFRINCKWVDDDGTIVQEDYIYVMPEEDADEYEEALYENGCYDVWIWRV